MQGAMGSADARGKSEIEVLEYPACPGASPLPAWNGWLKEDDGETEDAPVESHCGRAGAANGTPENRNGDEAGRSFEAGRERGRQEGRQIEREAQAAALAAAEERRKREIAGLVNRFAEEGDHFLHAVEHEVVKLALAVAARILRREAQMDPLLLTGAVRVALGQVAASSEVLLRVPAAEMELWTETIALIPNLTLKPSVVAGEGMRVGDCVIESKVGTVDLGVRSQLGEIERGFFDRAGASSSEKRALNEVSAAANVEVVEAEP